jgi:hypothetical protein
MKNLLVVSMIVGVALNGYHCATIESRFQPLLTKVFTYQGDLPPIKDDRTGEVIKGDAIESNSTTNSTSEAEKLCWDLIVDQSGESTF